MEWRPIVDDFLQAFRRFGFQDSKRSMSAKNKISSAEKATSTDQVVEFPTLNMRYVLVYFVLCIRAK